MEHETDAQPHETPHTRWQRRMAARPLAPVQTTWGMEVAPLYTVLCQQGWPLCQQDWPFGLKETQTAQGTGFWERFTGLDLRAICYYSCSTGIRLSRDSSMTSVT